jgi:hypothetical protein
MSGTIYKLVYVSSALELMTDQALLELLEKSWKNNGRRGISGVLLYFEGSFLQVLEGEETEVEALFSRIAADRRHTGVLRLYSEYAEVREFPDWSMGFRKLGKDSAPWEGEGFNGLLAPGSIPVAELENLSRRLRIFIRTFRRTCGLEDLSSD